jgi:hypothetical protein
MSIRLRILGEPSTDEFGRVALKFAAQPAGAVVDVSWTPVSAHASANYDGWGRRELDVLRAAMAEASRYMNEHPEKLHLYRPL